jgi:hypothetical protein
MQGHTAYKGITCKVLTYIEVTSQKDKKVALKKNLQNSGD